MLGVRLREHREHVGLSQDQLARRAREAGLDWKPATVAAIETERRELSLGEFLTLRGFPVRDDELADLFDRAASWRRAFTKARIESSLDAEIKAARKFGVEPEAIVAASRRLWGRTLTDERDRRLWEHGQAASQTTRTLQAHRGHVTRDLLAALETALKGKRRTRR